MRRGSEPVGAILDDDPEILVALAATWACMASAAQPRRIVVALSRVLDGRGGVLTDTRLVIEGRTIAAIDPAAAPVDYDLRGLTVMPGWIDTHVHLSWHFDERNHLVAGGDTPQIAARYTAENARVTLQAGFTTVQSLGAPVDRVVRDLVNRGDVVGPRILTSLGQVLDPSMSDGALRGLVRRIKAEGGDVIKVFATEGYDSGDVRVMSNVQLWVVCGEARAIGMRTAVHAVSDDGARAAVEAGCTSVEHGTFVADRTLDEMARRGTYFDPNLLMLHNYLDGRERFGLRSEEIESLERAVRPTADVLRRARQRHVKIVFGTDAVAGAHGRNAEEFIYRVREGREKPMDVLVSAASVAAESLGLDRTIGTIAAGYEADFVAVDGNPPTTSRPSAGCVCDEGRSGLPVTLTKYRSVATSNSSFGTAIFIVCHVVVG